MGNFEWRVGCDNATNPTTGVFWRIGKVLPDTAPQNADYDLGTLRD